MKQLHTLGLFLSLLCLSITANADTHLKSATVEDKSFPKVVVFDAVIEAIHRSTVSSHIAAEVIELNFDVNDVVAKGAVILKFRDDEFRARVAQVKANFSADKAQQQEANARLKEAASEALRVKKLFKRKLLAQAAMDKARASLAAANAQVHVVKARLKSRQAQLDEARTQLSYTQVIAPYSGIVTERLIELGEMASPGQHLITGVSLAHLRAVVNVPQYLLGAIQSAKSPELLLTDGRKVMGGKVTVIPQVDPKSHSFPVRVDLPEGVENVFPGMFAKLQFVTGEELVRVVPLSAIVQRSEVAGVYIHYEGSNKAVFRFRQVRLGRLFEQGQQEILAGLSEGEKVILEPYQAVKSLNSSRLNHE